MMKLKRGALIPLIFLSAISFVSAQFYRGYGRFSISNFFATIDPQTVTIITFFFIFFALLFYALTKVFKTPTGEPNKGIAGIISLAVSFLMVYGIYRQGFDLSSWFFRIGIPTDFFYEIMPFLLLAFAIILIWKTGIGVFLMVFGAIIFSIAVFTDIIYEKGIALVIGAILLFAGLFIRSRRARSYASTAGGWGGKKVLGGGRWAAQKVNPRLQSRLSRKERKIQRKEEKKQMRERLSELASGGRGQRKQKREEIGQRAKDVTYEIRNIDKYIENIQNEKNNARTNDQFSILQQEELRLRQERKELIKELRRLRRDHSRA
ncbi:MAG: hypothetical protein WDZ69_02115 [Candidatus Pacearchaeota archaeon]